MTRTRKLAAVVLLAAATFASALTAALAFDSTETYAYLPDHSVYFYDVTENYAWAHRQVDTLAVAGVIKGSGNHLFYPANAITRADFIVMLDRAFGMSEALDSGQIDSKGVFVDVPGNAYYSKSVTAAKAFGVATGTSDNRFLPQNYMTRQDAMVFLKRTLDCTHLSLQAGSLAAFSDTSQISSYATEAVSELVGAKVIGGTNGKLNPKANVTRAEMAVMLYRATHLESTGTGAVYEDKSNVVNVCIGAQSYCDVVIENYDSATKYTGLMGYTSLRQSGGVTYITLTGSRKNDQTVTYAGGQFTFTHPKTGQSTTLPASAGCVAVDVTQPYHQIKEPVSTGSTYLHAYPSVVNGQVAVVYYSKQ